MPKSFCCLCVRFAGNMDRSEWMYKISRVLDPRYLSEVRKFIVVARAHRDRSKRTTIVCPCSRCKNLTAFTNDGSVQSHLIRFGFVENYTVWSQHGESFDPSGGGASGVSSASTTAHQEPHAPHVSSSDTARPAFNDNNDCDYITVEDRLEDMEDDHGG